jgi:hypothetical protein
MLILKDMPFAVEASESYLSDINHDYRTRCSSYTPEWRARLEEQQRVSFGYGAVDALLRLLRIYNISCRVKRHPFTKPEEEIDERREIVVQLRGPCHPLEFKIAAAHRVGAAKEIRIEPDSVNSGERRQN